MPAAHKIARRPAIGPGRPKDLEKRAAILEAAKTLFLAHGFDGVSMDAIAAQAGVSKLTVYSHFKDKDTLFSETVRAKCEEQLPAALFTVDLTGPLRKQLRSIAKGFFGLTVSDEAISMTRMMHARARDDAKLPLLFWEAGPQRIIHAMAEFLEAEVTAGQLDIPDLYRAASQFIYLLKGEPHARMMCGICGPLTAQEIEAHVDATVDLFLRAYAPR